ERPEHPHHGCRVLQILFWSSPEQRLQVIKAHSRTERPAGSGQNHYDRVGVGYFIECTQKIVNQLEADCIALLRAVQPKGRNFAFIGKLKRLIAHGGSLCLLLNQRHGTLNTWRRCPRSPSTEYRVA